MAHKKKSIFKPRTERLSVRLEPDHYSLVEQAAENEGLQISSFIIMLLVRLRILPEICMKNLKRRPLAHFNELHELLGAINKIGSNCNQLLAAMPDLARVRSTQANINRAASVITDALQGKAVPASVDLGAFQAELTKEGRYLNDIARSVNMGKPDLSYLPTILVSIHNTADRLVSEFTSKPVMAEDAMEKQMRKAAAQQTKSDT